MRLILLIFLTSIFQFSFSQTEAAKIDWNKDIEFLRNELPKRHINLFFKKSKKEFDTGLDAIKRHKENLSDFEIEIKLQQFIASFGDSHTRVDWFDLLDIDNFLPIGLYWFPEGLYIIKTTEGNEDLLGKKIVKINGVQILQVVDSFATLIAYDNKAFIKDFVPNLIPSIQLLEFFDFTKKGIYDLELETENGKIINEKIERKIKGKQIVNFKTNKQIFSWQDRHISYLSKYFKNEKILYVKYNKCKPTSKVIKKDGTISEITFDDFQKTIFKTLRKENVDKLIFDMRFNSGGNSIYGTKFVNKLSKKKINKKGKLFVVIGRKTFSSAILNTMDFKDKTEAIFVGENTAGKPNQYGEVLSFKLPSSNIDIMYSIKYFKRVEKEINTINPDIKIVISFDEYKQGIDPVYEWIKNNSSVLK